MFPFVVENCHISGPKTQFQQTIHLHSIYWNSDVLVSCRNIRFLRTNSRFWIERKVFSQPDGQLQHLPAGRAMHTRRTPTPRLPSSGPVSGRITARQLQHNVGFLTHTVWWFYCLTTIWPPPHFLQSGKVEHVVVVVVNAWGGRVERDRDRSKKRKTDRETDRQRERQTSLGSSGYVPGKVGLLCPREVKGICCIANWWSLVNCGGRKGG